MTKIDVLLPTYNGADYLKPQIDSILSQTHSNLRLIIRDDQSQDQTVQIIKGYVDKDSRVLFITDTKENLGLVKSIEYLLTIADAPYIMFADQDDVWFPNKIEVFFKTAIASNDKASVLIHSDCFVTDEKLNIKNRFLDKKPLKIGLKNSLFHFYVQGSSTMINKKLKEESLPFPEDIYLHDRYLHIISEIKGNRFYINEPLMYYRQHGKNLVGSQSFLKKIMTNLKGNQKFYLKQDKSLILSVYKNKYPNNECLKEYAFITNDHVNRISKLYFMFINKIPMRLKEYVLLILKN